MSMRPFSHAERIHANLLDGLRTGRFAASSRFVDTDIAGEFGSSRVPAREALLRLAAEGYLVATTRGFAIPSLALDEISDLCEVRRQLEPRAAASAAANMTDGTRRELTEAITRIRAALLADDLPDLMRANVAFRSAWLGAVVNRKLADTIARFMDQFMTIRRGTFEHPVHRHIYAEGLEAIHCAFMKGDALKAGDAMMKFMFDAETAFLEVRAAELQDEATEADARGRRRRANEGRRNR